MIELRPHGRDLLERARRERTPDDGDRERVLAAVLAGLGETSVDTSGPPSLGGPSRSSLRWLVLAALAAVVTAAVYLASHVTAAPAPPRPGSTP